MSVSQIRNEEIKAAEFIKRHTNTPIQNTKLIFLTTKGTHIESFHNTRIDCVLLFDSIAKTIVSMLVFVWCWLELFWSERQYTQCHWNVCMCFRCVRMYVCACVLLLLFFELDSFSQNVFDLENVWIFYFRNKLIWIKDNSHRFLAGVRVWAETTSVRKMFLAAATAQIIAAPINDIGYCGDSQANVCTANRMIGVAQAFDWFMQVI